MKLPLVYFIRNTQDHIKIGYSGFLNERAGKVEPASPYPCELAATYAHPMARRIEPIMHKILDDARMSGEWFSCSLDRALVAIPMACAILRHRMKNEKPLNKSAASDDKGEFQFVVDWGGRSETARILNGAGTNVTNKDIYNWHRRGQVPAKIMQLVMEIRERQKMPVCSDMFLLVRQAPPKKIKMNERASA